MSLLTRFKDSLSNKKLFLNKYVIVSIAFLGWIAFFDNYGFVEQRNLSNKISELEKEKTEYEHKLAEAKKEKEEILNDKEKFAREKYIFHKDDEQVIIIPPKEK